MRPHSALSPPTGLSCVFNYCGKNAQTSSKKSLFTRAHVAVFFFNVCNFRELFTLSDLPSSMVAVIPHILRPYLTMSGIIALSLCKKTGQEGKIGSSSAHRHRSVSARLSSVGWARCSPEVDTLMSCDSNPAVHLSLFSYFFFVLTKSL